MAKIKLHKSCSTLPIYSFRKILETFDFRYLIIGYFGDEELYKKFDQNKGEEIFDTILKEYNLLTNETIELKNFKKKSQILELEFKYNTTISLLNIYDLSKSKDILFLISEVGWSIDHDKPYRPQINKIVNLCKGLKNKINIEKINYSNKYQKKQEHQKKKISLSKEAIYLQNNLELGYFLDIKTCSVETWVNLQQLSKEKEDYYKKQKEANKLKLNRRR